MDFTNALKAVADYPDNIMHIMVCICLDLQEAGGCMIPDNRKDARQSMCWTASSLISEAASLIKVADKLPSTASE